MSLFEQVVPLVETTRGGRMESGHLGALVVTDAAGTVLQSLGNPYLVNFPRSSLKAFQLASTIAHGAAERFGFGDREIAVMASSHSGEEIHVAAVLDVLNRIEAPPEVLACGPHLPLGLDAAERMQRANLFPSALHNNCSGKHAGMLTLARLLDAPLEGYLDPQHPAQQAIREALGEILGLDAQTLPYGIDGCSAPAYAPPLANMARAFAQLGDSDQAPPRWRAALARVAAAMRARPEMVGGTVGRMDTELMRLGTGLVAKAGAEGYFAVGHPSGLGLAVKILDGDATDRARRVAVHSALERLGWIGPDVDGGVSLPLANWAGLHIGEVHPAAALASLRPTGTS